MVDSVDRLRLGSARQLLESSAARLGDSIGSVFVGRVCDGGLRPTVVPRVFLVRPVRLIANETENATVSMVDGECAVYVLCLGPQPPREDDWVICRLDRGIWVAESATGPGVACCTDPCGTLPATLNLTVNWRGFVSPWTLGVPGDCVCQPCLLATRSATLTRVDPAGACPFWQGSIERFIIDETASPAVIRSDTADVFVLCALRGQPNRFAISIRAPLSFGPLLLPIFNYDPVVGNIAGARSTEYLTSSCSPIAITARERYFPQGGVTICGPRPYYVSNATVTI